MMRRIPQLFFVLIVGFQGGSLNVGKTTDISKEKSIEIDNDTLNVKLKT